MIRIAPLCDRDAIVRILCSASIAPKLRHAGREPGYIDHPLVSYWGAWVDDSLVGVFLGVRFSQWEMEAHIAILPEGVRHSRDLARAFLREMFAMPDIQRVTAYVMDTLPSAANFCRRLGFADEGRRRHAWSQDGEPHDVIILGMTREDWASCSECDDSVMS